MPRLRSLVVLLSVTAGVSQAAGPPASAPPPEGMLLVPGGRFMMGRHDAFPDESPVHEVEIDPFWMDRTEVTNAQFRAFVEATGYVTTAEQAPDWEALKAQLPPDTPRPPDEVLVPGSLVFRATTRPVSLRDPSAWWAWAPGADWRHPGGPGTSIEGLDDHPVVQVSWFDAVAYATWAGKRLPTEAEWELAARGGLDGAAFVWGDDPPTPGSANLWQGDFPVDNTAEDGFAGTAPVGSFPANGYGLSDMSGNVWEWCADWYRHDTYARRAEGGVAVNPTGPATSLDPQEPTIPKRVQRGGSFLCNDSYCLGYRPSARMKASADTSLAHTGFRCVISVGDPQAAASDEVSDEASGVAGEPPDTDRDGGG